MAKMLMEIKDTRRPCIIEGKDGSLTKCLFHCWSTESRVVSPSLMVGGHQGGTYSETVAVLEFEDGHVEKRMVGSFKFDDGGMLEDFIWFSDMEKENG